MTAMLWWTVCGEQQAAAEENRRRWLQAKHEGWLEEACRLIGVRPERLYAAISERCFFWSDRRKEAEEGLDQVWAERVRGVRLAGRRAAPAAESGDEHGRQTAEGIVRGTPL